jgi:hypothetical protein
VSVSLENLLKERRKAFLVTSIAAAAAAKSVIFDRRIKRTKTSFKEKFMKTNEI